MLDLLRPSKADRLEQAQRLIDQEDRLVIDVAANYGQMFFNVKDMSWFVRAVAEEVNVGR